MSASDIVTPQAATVIRDTKGSHDSHGCHGGFNVQPTVDLCGRDRHHGHHDRDGDFHILSGQHRASIQASDSGRFDDAAIARVLRAVGEAAEKNADRTQNLGLLLMKESGDSKQALLREVLEAKVSAAKDTLESKFAIAKEIAESRDAVRVAILENRVEIREAVCKLSDKVCDTKKEVLERLCDVRRDIKDLETERLKDRIQTLELRLRCDHDDRRGGHGG